MRRLMICGFFVLHDPTLGFDLPNEFTTFSIFLPNQGSFTSLAFNLGFQPATTGTVPITILEVNGDITQTSRSIGVLGGNFIGIIAINGQRILSAGGGFPITNISQIQIGDIQGGSTPTPVPEPASMLMLATGLVGVGLRRWRLRQA